MINIATAPAPAAPVASVTGPLPRFRFVALGVVWSACLVVFFSHLCVGPLSPFLKQDFDPSNAQIGGLTSATAVTYAPTLVLAGWLVDRIGVNQAAVNMSGILGAAIMPGSSNHLHSEGERSSCYRRARLGYGRNRGGRSVMTVSPVAGGST